MGGCRGVDVGDGEAVDGVGHALARGDGFGGVPGFVAGADTAAFVEGLAVGCRLLLVLAAARGFGDGLCLEVRRDAVFGGGVIVVEDVTGFFAGTGVDLVEVLAHGMEVFHVLGEVLQRDVEVGVVGEQVAVVAVVANLPGIGENLFGFEVGLIHRDFGAVVVLDHDVVEGGFVVAGFVRIDAAVEKGAREHTAVHVGEAGRGGRSCWECEGREQAAAGQGADDVLLPGGFLGSHGGWESFFLFLFCLLTGDMIANDSQK